MIDIYHHEIREIPRLTGFFETYFAKAWNMTVASVARYIEASEFITHTRLVAAPFFSKHPALLARNW